MRRAQVWGCAAVLGQGRVRGLSLLLLLLEPRQAEEQAEDGLQITIPDLFCRQALDVDSFGCEETEAGVDVLDLTVNLAVVSMPGLNFPSLKQPIKLPAESNYEDPIFC